MNQIELFSIRHIESDTEVRNRLSREGVNQEIRTIQNLGLDASLFSVESEGHFTYREVTTQYNSMSQADIDLGGDNDPYELTHRIYKPINQ
jgi:hypothetical protein